jgi:hypothetical protein
VKKPSKAKSKAKPAAKIKDLKPRKNPKGGLRIKLKDVLISS